jgi:hypothetical protein
MRNRLSIFITFLVSCSAYAQVDSEISHPELRSELLEMMRVDQEARTRTPIDPEEMGEVDQRNTARLIEIVKEHGWPTISMVSDAGARAAWLLAQHADQMPAFQEDVLSLMKPLLEKGEVLRSNYACLYDRTSSPQLYGTQGRCAGPGAWVPLDIEDPEHVNGRRASMEINLPRLEDYISRMNELCK